MPSNARRSGFGSGFAAEGGWKSGTRVVDGACAGFKCSVGAVRRLGRAAGRVGRSVWSSHRLDATGGGYRSYADRLLMLDRGWCAARFGVIGSSGRFQGLGLDRIGCAGVFQRTGSARIGCVGIFQCPVLSRIRCVGIFQRTGSGRIECAGIFQRTGSGRIGCAGMVRVSCSGARMSGRRTSLMQVRGWRFGNRRGAGVVWRRGILLRFSSRRIFRNGAGAGRGGGASIFLKPGGPLARGVHWGGAR